MEQKLHPWRVPTSVPCYGVHQYPIASSCLLIFDSKWWILAFEVWDAHPLGICSFLEWQFILEAILSFKLSFLICPMNSHWHTFGFKICCISRQGHPNTQSSYYIPGKKQEYAKEFVDGELSIRVEPCSSGEAERGQGVRRGDLGHGAPQSWNQDRNPLRGHKPHSWEGPMGLLRRSWAGLCSTTPHTYWPTLICSHTNIAHSNTKTFTETHKYKYTQTHQALRVTDTTSTHIYTQTYTQTHH